MNTGDTLQRLNPNDQWIFNTNGDLVGIKNPRSTGNDFRLASDSEPILALDGTAAAPSYSFASNTDLGIYREAANRLGLGVSGVQKISFRASGPVFASDGAVSWSSGTANLAADLFLVRDAANTLAQRNGTAAQAFNLYNTFTDGS